MPIPHDLSRARWGLDDYKDPSGFSAFLDALYDAGQRAGEEWERTAAQVLALAEAWGKIMTDRFAEMLPEGYIFRWDTEPVLGG